LSSSGFPAALRRTAWPFGTLAVSPIFFANPEKMILSQYIWKPTVFVNFRKKSLIYVDECIVSAIFPAYNSFAKQTQRNPETLFRSFQ
jgi:hypothetical protein